MPSNSGLRNFRRIESAIDTTMVLSELKAAADAWSVNTRRQAEIPVHRETNSIILRTASTGEYHIGGVENVLACQTMPEAASFPCLMQFLTEFSRRQQATLQRVMIVRLKPGGRVYPHSDNGQYYELTNRYHLVLSSSGGSRMSSGNETIVMHEGELWWFQNKLTHHAHNDSNDWRVHVIFDLLPTRPRPYRLTPIEQDMHQRLFGSAARRIQPVSDAEMWCVLRELRTASELDPFRLWLIGSRAEPGNNTSDIDVLLSPRDDAPLSDSVIERGLWYCRHYGLYLAGRTCVLDPCFRAEGPTLEVTPLQHDKSLQTIRLFSPKALREVTAGRIRQYRRLGYFSIEYCRRAGDTGFYRKLPTQSFKSMESPYLRPAIEIVSK